MVDVLENDGLDFVKSEDSDGSEGVMVVVIKGYDNGGGMLTEVTTGWGSCGVVRRRWIALSFALEGCGLFQGGNSSMTRGC